MGLKVMIVDDSLFMRNMLKKMISEAGANVIGEAGDGREAIDKFNQLKPDLIFLDIVMPNLSGLEVLTEIMKIKSDTKVIMCTSTGQEIVVKEAVEKGASDFIVKPFTKNDIDEIIKKYSS